MWYARVTQDIASCVSYMMLLVHTRIDDLDQVSHDNLQGLITAEEYQYQITNLLLA